MKWPEISEISLARAIEVQVLDGLNTPDYTSHGDLFSIHGAHLQPDRPHPKGWERCLPSEHRSKPAGEWNHYRVEANNGVLKLAVNGKVVSGASRTGTCPSPKPPDRRESSSVSSP